MDAKKQTSQGSGAEQQQGGGGGNQLTCENIGVCAPITTMQGKVDQLVTGLNVSIYGFYEKSMLTTRILASKVREFGNAMLGLEKEPFPKTHYDAIMRMKSNKPKLYKELSEFATSLNKLPFEVRGEQTIQFINQLIKSGLLVLPTASSET
jgi:hypothetical protein